MDLVGLVQGNSVNSKNVRHLPDARGHSDLADSREGERARSAHPHELTRDPLIDHPRPALPRCCRLPPPPHRCSLTALATWARLGCSYADNVTLLLLRQCYHTAILIMSRRCHQAADATLLTLPQCRCGHTAAAPPLAPPCATARRGRPEAYPKGRPYRQKSDPAPPEIGRGSKRALTHRARKSNRPHVRQGRSPRPLGNHPPSPGEVSSGP